MADVSGAVRVAGVGRFGFCLPPSPYPGWLDPPQLPKRGRLLRVLRHPFAISETTGTHAPTSIPATPQPDESPPNRRSEGRLTAVESTIRRRHDFGGPCSETSVTLLYPSLPGCARSARSDNRRTFGRKPVSYAIACDPVAAAWPPCPSSRSDDKRRADCVLFCCRHPRSRIGSCQLRYISRGNFILTCC